MQRRCVVFLILLFLILVFATTLRATTLQEVLCDVKDTIMDLIPTVSLLMIVLAAFAYMFGQYFGAEIRARAIGYSTSLIVGAIVAFLIVQFSNIVITKMFGTLPC